MMTDKMMLDVLLHASKQYIDGILKGYGTTNKELASFEKNNMARYSGDAPIDHVLFRKFLRRFNPDKIKEEISEEISEEIDQIYAIQLKTIIGEKSNEEKPSRS
jgi:tRNA(Ser,Leu) C12 N-acetylase TAN1